MRKIIYKNNGLNNQPDSPTGYKFVGYDNDTFSEKDGSVISAIGGSGGSNIIEKTYLELTTMLRNSELDPGQLYLMTDFQTIYDQPDYSDAYTPKETVVTKTAAVDPIILLAISETEFAKEVWRPSTPKHTLEYDIRFRQTEVMRAPAKGRITYCKDEFDNETHYDHTVVLLKRYESESGSGIFNSFWDTGFGSTEVLTFGAESILNKIEDNYYGLARGFAVRGFAVSNNVLGEGSLGNIIGGASNNNTFGNNTRGNTFGGYTIGNTFGNDTEYNTFGNNTQRNTFGDNTSSNTFGNDTRGNTFGNYTKGNFFGNETIANTFGNITYNNTFGNGTGGDVLTPYPNTFGNDTRGNTFGNNTQRNTFGDNTSYNTFGDGAYNNRFGDWTQRNTFGNYSMEDIDFTITPSAHIYGNYPCNIFRRQDGTVRLSYYNDLDDLVVVDPTD